VNVTFKEFEVAGWRESGRGDAYDAVVGRVTARVAEPLLDAVGVRAGTSLLDVATGTGHVAGAAAARGARGVGVDISEEMLARARRLYDGVEFALGDAEELAFEDNAFDAAVAAFLLHHVPSPERVVAELARVASRVAVAQWDATERARLIGLLTDAIAAAGVEPHYRHGRTAALWSDRQPLPRPPLLRCTRASASMGFALDTGGRACRHRPTEPFEGQHARRAARPEERHHDDAALDRAGRREVVDSLVGRLVLDEDGLVVVHDPGRDPGLPGLPRREVLLGVRAAGGERHEQPRRPLDHLDRHVVARDQRTQPELPVLHSAPPRSGARGPAPPSGPT